MNPPPSQLLQIDPSLKRYPFLKHEKLQAWDSADELILQHLSTLSLESKRILIINDSFGAISHALRGFQSVTYNDSYCAIQAIHNNGQNQLTPVRQISELQGPFDLAVIRIPKNMSYFEDILCHVSGLLKPEAPLVCGYMIKHQAKMSFDLLNRLIGETHTSLAQKKARLIFARLQMPPSQTPYPLKISIPPFDKPFVNESNLFSRESLDMGTRFFLQHLPAGDFRNILDLGCGNGIIGISAQQKYPEAQLSFTDDSWMAILSAQQNVQTHVAQQPQFIWTNAYENQPLSKMDLVLCNPPFHQGHVLGDQVARTMFKNAHSALQANGLLRVIGNTHLKYQVPLKRIFGNAKIVATNQKFMIIDAVRT